MKGICKMKNEPFMMELQCKLTEEDKAQISKMIVDKLSEKEDFEAAKSAATGHWGGKIKVVNQEIASLAKKHREGHELRDVECYTHFNWADGIATVYRADLNEKVSSRIITSAERQRQIDDEDEFQETEEAVDQAFDEMEAEGDPDEAGRSASAIESNSIPGDEEESPNKSGPQAEDVQPSIKRDDKALRNLLKEILEKAPTLKTIRLYTDDNYQEVLAWASAVKMAEDPENEIKVPYKPAFVGKLK
jgi:hypothetical protein